MADKEEKATKVDPIGSKTYLTDLDVRIWLRDNDPEANKLLDDYEFSPEEIRTAMTLTVDHWNDQPPYIKSYDYDKFPYRSKLLQGTAANLLFMAAHRFRRDSLQYSAGGLTIQDQEKYQQYDNAGNGLWQQYHEWVMWNKRSLNAEQGFATI